MSTWPNKYLGIICDVRDGTHDSPKQVLQGKPLVTSRHIKQGRIDFQNAYNISLEDFEAVNKRSKVDKYDILFSMIGTVGEMALIDFEPDFAIKNIGLFKTNGDMQLAKWILYYLKSKDAQAEIDACLKGSTQQYITLGDLRKFPIALPPLSEQKAIASVLSSLDDKIDLLHRQNKTLEAMAETLFRQWFVEEEEEDWEEGKIIDLFVLQRGYDLPVQNRIKGNYPVISSRGISGTHKEYKIKGPGVVTGRSGLLGSVHYIQNDFWPLNTSLYIKEFKTATPIYSFFFLKTLDLKTFNAGSSVPTLNRNHVHDEDTILPPKNKILKFEGIGHTYFSKISNNDKQISILEKLRNTILPKLMSGEVRIQN